MLHKEDSLYSYTHSHTHPSTHTLPDYLGKDDKLKIGDRTGAQRWKRVKSAAHVLVLFEF